MVRQFIQIECDQCGNCDNYPGTKKEAMEYFRVMGWIVSKGKHFCNEECKEEYQNESVQ